MTKPILKLDWCSHEAAKYACEKWHYTQKLPVGKMVKVGIWENDVFVGVVIFAWGMNRNLGSPYSLEIVECCELVRVAMSKHQSSVTRVLRVAIAFLKKQSKGLRLVVSFADPEQGHVRGIYQAGNWIYSGLSSDGFEWILNGTRLNKRAYTGGNFGNPKMEIPDGAVKRKICGKHRYLMPLDEEMRKQVQSLAKPYPKRVRSTDSGTSGDQSEGGGANPTRTLKTDDEDSNGPQPTTT